MQPVVRRPCARTQDVRRKARSATRISFSIFSRASLKKSAAASYERGVAVEWLVKFTNKHNLWDVTTDDVVRQVIKVRTEFLKCRYVELPEMRDAVSVSESLRFKPRFLPR